VRATPSRPDGTPDGTPDLLGAHPDSDAREQGEDVGELAGDEAVERAPQP
jgi:hypothetical protein